MHFRSLSPETRVTFAYYPPVSCAVLGSFLVPACWTHVCYHTVCAQHTDSHRASKTPRAACYRPRTSLNEPPGTSGSSSGQGWVAKQ